MPVDGKYVEAMAALDEAADAVWDQASAYGTVRRRTLGCGEPCPADVIDISNPVGHDLSASRGDELGGRGSRAVADGRSRQGLR